jgi:exosortase
MSSHSAATAPVVAISRGTGIVTTVVASTVLVCAILVVYHQVLWELVLDWWTVSSLSQGFLIPPLAIWIGWSIRGRVAAMPANRSSAGLVVVAIACGMLLFGQLAAEYFISRISFVVLVAGLFWTFWGYHRLRVLAFPFLLLATMVPLPSLVYNSLAAPLQLFATAVSARLAEMVGVTVFTDGNIIHLASASLGVEEACSGLSSLSALVVGSVLLGYVQCSTPACRIALFLFAVPASILTNIIRVAGTAILADYDPKFALGFYHSFSGWLVFVLGFGMLYAAAVALERLEARR